MTNMDNLTQEEYENIIIDLLKDISASPEARRIMTTKLSMVKACLAVHKRLMETPNESA
jgi:hypothetical protein